MSKKSNASIFNGVSERIHKALDDIVSASKVNNQEDINSNNLLDDQDNSRKDRIFEEFSSNLKKARKETKQLAEKRLKNKNFLRYTCCSKKHKLYTL